MVEVIDPTLTLASRGVLFDAHRALVERLRLAFPPRQFKHQVVPAQLSRPVWNTMVDKERTVATGFVGLAPDRSMGRIYYGAAKFMVFIVIKNPKAEGLLLGDAAGGIAQLGVVQLAVALLHAWPVAGLGTWEVGDVRNAYAEEWVHDDVALTAIEVSITVQVTDEAAAEALPEFLRLGAQWGVPDLADGFETLDDVRPAA